jgi:hypothetical protein
MTRRHQTALGAALMIGVGFFLMRLWASGGKDMLLAVSLTLIEFAAVLFLEVKAKGLSAGIADRHEQERQIGQAELRSEAASMEAARRKALFDEAIAERSQIEWEIEQDHLLSDLKGLITIARNATRGGYLRGIAANAGEISGMSRLEVAA